MDAKDGYFLAKRQIVEALDVRIENLYAQIKLSGRDSQFHLDGAVVLELERLRDYVRNCMLWKNEDLA